MKHLAIALTCALSLLLGAQGAVAGPGKQVPTKLVPIAPQVETPPPPVKKCRLVRSADTSVVQSPGVSVVAQFIQSGCCCATQGLFVSGVMVLSQSTPTTLIQTIQICE